MGPRLFAAVLRRRAPWGSHSIQWLRLGKKITGKTLLLDSPRRATQRLSQLNQRKWIMLTGTRPGQCAQTGNRDGGNDLLHARNGPLPDGIESRCEEGARRMRCKKRIDLPVRLVACSGGLGQPLRGSLGYWSGTDCPCRSRGRC